MSNFAPLINDPPIDPKDARFNYGFDFVNVVDDGGTLTTPTAAIDAAGTAAGVTLNDVQFINTTQLVFRPTVAGGNQSDAVYSDEGARFLVTVTFLNASAQLIERSGYLWFAQR